MTDEEFSAFEPMPEQLEELHRLEEAHREEAEQSDWLPDAVEEAKRIARREKMPRGNKPAARRRGSVYST